MVCTYRHIVFGLLLATAGLQAQAACSDPAAPGVDWSGCDLAARNLSNLDLRGAIFSSVNFSNVDLRRQQYPLL